MFTETRILFQDTLDSSNWEEVEEAEIELTEATQ